MAPYTKRLDASVLRIISAATRQDYTGDDMGPLIKQRQLPKTMRGGFVRRSEAVAPDAYVSGIARMVTALPDRVDHEGTVIPGFCPKLGQLFSGIQAQDAMEDGLSCEHFSHFLYNSDTPLSKSFMDVWESTVIQVLSLHAIIRDAGLEEIPGPLFQAPENIGLSDTSGMFIPKQASFDEKPESRSRQAADQAAWFEAS